MNSVLKKGKEIFLTVVPSIKKKGAKEFSPAFLAIDPNAGNAKSIRIWNPVNNGFNLQDGEEYRVEVLGWDSPKLESRQTKDGRRYLYVKVKVICRIEEVINNYFNPSKGVYVTVIKSGITTFNKTEPAFLKVEHFRLSDRKNIVRVEEVVLVGSGVVVERKTDKISREDFAKDVAVRMNANEDAVKEMIKMLRPMDLNEFLGNGKPALPSIQQVVEDKTPRAETEMVRRIEIGAIG